MLQFNHSATVNSNAVYPNVTASVGTTTLLLDFTQSYDLSTKGEVIVTMINTVSPSNEWLVFQVTGSSVPTASGQYNVDIYNYTSSLSGSNIWVNQNTLWASTAITWDFAGTPSYLRTQLLSTERAFVSGSNGYDITQYLLPANGGTYTTYNHP
jgi:hypothetical protein